MSTVGQQDPKIIIHGWRSAGPLVDVEEYQQGFGNRRQRWKKVVEHKPTRGRDLQKPAYERVHRVEDPGYDVIAFNKGHFYLVRVIVDGRLDDPHDLMVDALQGYGSVKIPDGVDIVDVTPFDSGEDALKSLQPSSGDDEDDVQTSGNAADEEE